MINIYNTVLPSYQGALRTTWGRLISFISFRRAFSNNEWFGPRRKGGNFVDQVRIRIEGGAGGAGSSSFHLGRRIRKGKPSGGDGGGGGDILIVATDSLSSLGHLPGFVKAEGGGKGGRNNRAGMVGGDVLLKVPFGTTVKEIIESTDDIDEENCSANDYLAKGIVYISGCVGEGGRVQIVSSSDPFGLGDGNAIPADEAGEDGIGGTDEMDELGEDPHESPFGGVRAEISEMESYPLEEFELNADYRGPIKIARGGRGGRGNLSLGHNNHDSENGQAGEKRYIQLDLRTIADVGLVGLPNAGKSSLLAAISNAHPQVAAYPFTTLNPYVGVVEFADGGRFTMADIPGLIEGAHANRGLGHTFLKHIVKSKLLAFVIDFSDPAPWDSFSTLHNELGLYESGLGDKCKMIVANKADLLTGEQLMRQVDTFKKEVWKDGFQPVILPISALHALAVTKVTITLRTLIEDKMRSK